MGWGWRRPLLTAGFDGLHNVAFLPGWPAANHWETIVNLDLNLIRLGNRFKFSSRRFDPEPSPFTKSETFADRLRDDESPRFAKGDGNAHANSIATIASVCKQLMASNGDDSLR